MSPLERRLRVGVFEPWPRFDRAGLYRRIAAHPQIEFTALYSSSAGVRPGRVGFGGAVAFDVDALSGFTSVFLRRADQTEHDGSFFSLRDSDLPAEMARRRFDVLWLHGYYSASHLLAAATQLGRGGRLLIREEQTLLHSRPLWKRTLKTPLLKALFRGSTGLYQGTLNYAWFRRYGMPASRLFQVPICVDNDALRVEAEALRPRRQELRLSFGVPADAGPLILTAGRLIPKKRMLVLLEAFRRLRQRQRCALLVVGSGECETEIRRYVTEHSVPDVVLAGFLNQSEIPRAYAAADVFALASGWDETWGLVVNEAMNFQLPVVVSDMVGCAPDLVRPGQNGYVFRNGDAEALSRYLELLVTDAGRRRSFGERSMDLVERWSYDAGAAQFFAALRASAAPRCFGAAGPLPIET